MSVDRYQAKFATAVCVLGIHTEGDAVAEIVFLPKSHRELAPRTAVAERVCAQVERYLADPGFRFDLPLRPAGTAFQRGVWDRISAIRPGRTRTYGEIAAQIGSAARAVGQACGANPYPLAIPCHRVVASGGLGGFARHDGGFHLSVKRWLLEHERSLGG